MHWFRFLEKRSNCKLSKPLNDMKNLIQEKRDSLEMFIREQMVGPNGCRGRFSLEMEGSKTFDGEIINTTPGSIYSTAVLFPRKAVGLFDDIEAPANPDAEEGEDISTNGEEEDERLRSDSNELNGALGNDVDDEDVYSLSRRFPNTSGFNFNKFAINIRNSNS